MNTEAGWTKARAWTLAPEFVARLLEGMSVAEVRVFDPLGRQVLAERVNNSVGIVELSAQGLSRGLHSVVLLADGLKVGTAKFEIIH